MPGSRGIFRWPTTQQGSLAAPTPCIGGALQAHIQQPGCQPHSPIPHSRGTPQEHTQGLIHQPLTSLHAPVAHCRHTSNGQDASPFRCMPLGHTAGTHSAAWMSPPQSVHCTLQWHAAGTHTEAWMPAPQSVHLILCGTHLIHKLSRRAVA